MRCRPNSTWPACSTQLCRAIKANSKWYSGVGVGLTNTKGLPPIIIQGLTPSEKYSDLPRDEFGEAQIGDGRNDSNLAVAQIYVVLAKFHQETAKAFKSPDRAKANTLRLVQEAVLFDFLEKVSDPPTYCDILCNGRQLVRPGAFDFSRPFLIPIEFAAACFRIGHSMVREAYTPWHWPKNRQTWSVSS